MEEDIVRISELPGANPLAGPELVPLVQDGVTKTRSVVDVVLDGGLQDHLDGSDPHNQYAFRVKNNLEATTNPTVNDDINEGYTPTSRWVNTVTEEFYICVTNAAGNANWQTLTLTLDELGSAALADTGAGNGLDADLLDAQQGSYYLDFPNFTNLPNPVLTLAGDVSGTATLTNLGDATLTVTVDDNSHDHTINNVTGLQAALNEKIDSVNGKEGDVVLVTDDISEDGAPLNLWFTNTRARNAISASGDVSYNPTTGVISYSETYSTPSELLTAIKTVDGAGSGLDADLLDGNSSAFFRNAGNLNAGTVPDARLPNTITSSITGNAATATKLATARSIALGGDLSGSANFDGSSNITINASGISEYGLGSGSGRQFDGNDLNNGLESGFYDVVTGDLNTPAGATVNASTVIVSMSRAGGNGGQIFIDRLNGDSYIRGYAGSWTPWRTLFHSGNSNAFTTADENKLDGIESGAEVNTVDSVNGQTGVVNIDALDIDYDNTTSGLSATDVKGAIDEVATSSSVPANLEVADYIRHTGDTNTGLFFPNTDVVELRAFSRDVFSSNGLETFIGGGNTLQLGNFSGNIFLPVWFISQTSTSIQETIANFNKIGTYIGYANDSSRIEAYSLANVGASNFFYAGIGFESTYGNDGTALLEADSGAGSEVLAITRLNVGETYSNRWTMRQDVDSDDWEFRGNVTIPDGQIGSNATRDVLIQTSEPTSGQGNDGDVCYVYTP